MTQEDGEKCPPQEPGNMEMCAKDMMFLYKPVYVRHLLLKSLIIVGTLKFKQELESRFQFLLLDEYLFALA